MKPNTAMTREEIACLLVAEGYNATELAEALQMTRQSAMSIMRRIDRNRLRKRLSAASVASRSTALDSPTLQPRIGLGG